MTLSVKEMLSDCAKLLHKSNIVTYLADTSGTVTAPDELDLLVLCVNNVVSELACDYVPCIATEEVVVTNGKVASSDLTKTLLSFKRITDCYGRNVKFKIENGSIALNNGVYSVEYCYLPAKCTVSSSLTDFPSNVTSRVLVQGIVAEYYLVTGQYDEASMWLERFNQSISMPATKLKNLVMRGRKW